MNEVTAFMDQARDDPRIGPQHISLYMALLYWREVQGADQVVLVSGRELGPVAKIVGGTPFYRCLRDLHRFGYIVYEPSFNPVTRSRVRFLLMEDQVSIG
jgi:hypothetical protein